jgi:cytochrome c-type biogenesis protein CcmH
VKLVTLLAALLVLLAPAAARASDQHPTLADMEDEVMCVECGTSLEVSQSPVANQERDFIREQIAAGKDKAQIKAALVDEYGKEVLATPDGKGFNAALWIVPVLIVLFGALTIFFAVKRWRRAGPEQEDEIAPALSADDARRLDAELSSR